MLEPLYPGLNSACRDADVFKALVLKRFGCTAAQLKCPYQRSEMTPCIGLDGGLAVCETTGHDFLCVGCERGVAGLLRKERERANPQRVADSPTRESAGPDAAVAGVGVDRRDP
jgi:hypothetical protein